MKAKDLRLLMQSLYALIMLILFLFTENAESILSMEILEMELPITILGVVFFFVLGFTLWHLFTEYIVQKYSK